jgi:hypothetical protein
MPVSRYRYVFVLTLFALIPAIANAALLNANSGLLNAGGPQSPPTGPIFTSVTSPFATSDLNGTITTDVYANDTTNTFGGLTFVYTVHNNPTSVDAIGRATVTDYNGVSTDASFVAVPGTFVVPGSVNRSASSDVVGWNFQDGSGANTLGTGLSSVPLVLRTDSTNFAPNTANIIDGSTTPAAALGPAAGILPEPAMLSALSLIGLVFARRR